VGLVEMFVELPISVVTASTALVLYIHKINQLGVQHGKNIKRCQSLSAASDVFLPQSVC